jgi:hypothetical protein
MLFKWFGRGVLIAAYIAVCVYAVVAETGPIGWINYAQQSVFGSYSQKLTMLIAIVASVVVLAPLWWGIDALGRRLGVPDVLPGPARLAEPARPPSGKAFLLSSFVAIPLIWIGGYAIWWYQQHEHQQDGAATYEPLRLVRGAPPTAASGAYLAVSGRLLWERTVSLTKGSSQTVEYTLVPLVAEGWRDRDLVPYVVRVDNRNRYLAERATRNREVVLGHAEGGVAVPAAQEFLKMQVPVGDATRLLRLVPSEGGAPAVRDSADEDFKIYMIIAAGLSVFYVLIMLVIVAANANQRRRERKAALRQAGR